MVGIRSRHMRNIKTKSVRGVKWSAVENFGVKTLSLVAFLVLARLLDEKAFGIVALGMAYVTFLELVVRVGFTEVIVQKQELSDTDKDTAFWAALALGLVGLAASWLLAPMAAAWSGNEELEPVLKWLAVGILPLALTRVQHGILARDLNFRGLAVRGLAGVSVGSSVGIGCAFAGFGVWSLVAQQLVTRLVDFLTLYWVAKWLPRLRFSTGSLAAMLSYGWKILGINIVQAGSSQADRFIIGHFLGVSALGVYVVGRKIVEVIFRMMRSIIGRVALSAFSRIQADKKRLSRASLTVAQLSFATGMPVLVFIVIVGDDLNRFIFGDKWADAGLIMQLSAAACAARLVSLFIVPMYKAIGRPGKVLTATGVQAIASIVLSIALSGYGLDAMAAGWLAGEVIGAALLLIGIGKTEVVTTSGIIRQYSPLALAGLGGVGLLLLGDYYSPTGGDEKLWLVLAYNCVLFSLGYLLTLRLITPTTYFSIMKDMSGFIKG